MHNLRINVNNEAYNHLIYLLNDMSNVEIIEDNIVADREEFLKRVKSSDNDIKNGQVSDFDFNSFEKDLDVSL